MTDDTQCLAGGIVIAGILFWVLMWYFTMGKPCVDCGKRVKSVSVRRKYSRYGFTSYQPKRCPDCANKAKENQSQDN